MATETQGKRGAKRGRTTRTRGGKDNEVVVVAARGDTRATAAASGSETTQPAGGEALVPMAHTREGPDGDISDRKISNESRIRHSQTLFCPSSSIRVLSLCQCFQLLFCEQLFLSWCIFLDDGLRSPPDHLDRSAWHTRRAACRICGSFSTLLELGIDILAAPLNRSPFDPLPKPVELYPPWPLRSFCSSADAPPPALPPPRCRCRAWVRKNVAFSGHRVRYIGPNACSIPVLAGCSCWSVKKLLWVEGPRIGRARGCIDGFALLCGCVCCIV